jgi:hypothetical protein
VVHILFLDPNYNFFLLFHCCHISNIDLRFNNMIVCGNLSKDFEFFNIQLHIAVVT